MSDSQNHHVTRRGRIARLASRLRRARPSGTNRSLALFAAVAMLPGLALAGCGDDDDDDASTPTSGDAATTINAVERDGTITLDRASSTSGHIEFAIKNEGELTHEFVVLKTDLAEGALPLDSAGSAVDESGAGVTVAGERESIAPATSAALTVDDLAPGTYVIICNVPGHYGLGMHASFVVG